MALPTIEINHVHFLTWPLLAYVEKLGLSKLWTMSQWPNLTTFGPFLVKTLDKHKFFIFET